MISALDAIWSDIDYMDEVSSLLLYLFCHY